MKLDTVILADAANEAQGKLNMLGAGISRITAPIIPWTQPTLAVIVRAVLEADDLERDHQITLEILGPDDKALVPALRAQATPDELRPILERTVEGELTTLQAHFSVNGIVFPSVGLYHFVVDLDGEVARYPLPVVQAPG